MTKITAEAMALVDRAGKEWTRHKVFRASIEATIRARVEKEMAEEVERSAFQVASAMKAAIDGGATKAALRVVTTRDFRTFKSFLDLADPNAETATTDAPPAPEAGSAEVGLTIEWERDEVLRIALEPSTVAPTEYDRGTPHLWEGLFEVYIRPADGAVFIDPTGDGGFEVGIAVTEWLRADPANHARVVAWVTDNPQG